MEARVLHQQIKTESARPAKSQLKTPRRVTALELALLNDPKHTKMGPLDKRHPLDKIASAMIRSGQPVVVGFSE
jgi:hypothetical protein